MMYISGKWRLMRMFHSDELANFLMPMLIYVYGGLLNFLMAVPTFIQAQLGV